MTYHASRPSAGFTEDNSARGFVSAPFGLSLGTGPDLTSDLRHREGEAVGTGHIIDNGSGKSDTVVFDSMSYASAKECANTWIQFLSL